MNIQLKKCIRTIQTSFPHFLEAKFKVMRHYRRVSGVPFDEDFMALPLFPDIDGALYLDVGGNRGQSTDAILMATANSQIQIFEPNPLLCAQLERYWLANGRVLINSFGLGDRAAEQPLYIPFYKKWMFDGLASFDEVKARDWLKGRIFFYKERHLSVHSVLCRIKCLDELKLVPFFIKLDVQGFEYRVIKGGQCTIRTHEPVLLVEAPTDDIFTLLKECGYQFYAFRNGQFIRGLRGQGNTFFMTASKARLVERHIRTTSCNCS